MNRFIRYLSIFLAIISVSLLCASCIDLTGQNGQDGTDASTTVDNNQGLVQRDHTAELKLDMSTGTKKQEVTVKAYIDGDTTHFNVPNSVAENGVLKARYLAINTPESTGKIEEYGKKAASFTKEKLSHASKILIESDDDQWNIDSTGGRHLVWVWYKSSDNEDYRNLNLEILENGLAIASSSANNRYGDICMSAIAKAKALTLNIHSKQPDPDFFYGEAIELTLKELRCNIAEYNGSKVAFNGVITRNNNNSVYIEDYDSETDMYYGISIYYGYSLGGEGLDILNVGNYSRIVGTVSYYEAGGTYQVSGLTYRQMKPKDPGNIQKLGDGRSPAYVKITADKLLNEKVAITSEEGETQSLRFAELAMNTSVSMDALKVVRAYTTSNEGSSSFGAITLTCEADGMEVVVRTTVLTDKDGNLVKQEAYEGKTINVKGLIDYFDGVYQIKVFSANDITITA